MSTNIQQLQRLQRIFFHLKRSQAAQSRRTAKHTGDVDTPKEDTSTSQSESETSVSTTEGSNGKKNPSTSYGFPPGCTAIELLDDEDIRNWFVQFTYRDPKNDSTEKWNHSSSSRGLNSRKGGNSSHHPSDEDDSASTLTVSLRIMFLEDLPLHMPLVFVAQPRLIASFIHYGAICSLELMSQHWEVTEENVFLLLASLYTTLYPFEGKVTIDGSKPTYTDAEHERGVQHIQQAHPHLFRSNKRNVTGLSQSVLGSASSEEVAAAAPSSATEPSTRQTPQISGTSAADNQLGMTNVGSPGTRSATESSVAPTSVGIQTESQLMNIFLQSMRQADKSTQTLGQLATFMPDCPPVFTATCSEMPVGSCDGDVVLPVTSQQHPDSLPHPLSDVQHVEQEGIRTHVLSEWFFELPPADRTAEPRNTYNVCIDGTRIVLNGPNALLPWQDQRRPVLRLPTRVNGNNSAAAHVFGGDGELPSGAARDSASSIRPFGSSRSDDDSNMENVQQHYEVPAGCTLELRHVTLIGCISVNGILRMDNCRFMGKIMTEGSGELRTDNTLLQLVCEHPKEGMLVLDSSAVCLNATVVQRIVPYSLVDDKQLAAEEAANGTGGNPNNTNNSSAATPTSPVANASVDPSGATVNVDGVQEAKDASSAPHAAGADTYDFYISHRYTTEDLRARGVIPAHNNDLKPIDLVAVISQSEAAGQNENGSAQSQDQGSLGATSEPRSSVLREELNYYALDDRSSTADNADDGNMNAEMKRKASIDDSRDAKKMGKINWLMKSKEDDDDGEGDGEGENEDDDDDAYSVVCYGYEMQPLKRPRKVVNKVEDEEALRVKAEVDTILAARARGTPLEYVGGSERMRRNMVNAQVAVKALIQVSNGATLQVRDRSVLLQLNTERTIFAEQDATVDITNSTIAAGSSSAVCIQGCRGFFSHCVFFRQEGPNMSFNLSDATRPTGVNVELGGIITVSHCIAKYLYFGFSVIAHSVAHFFACHAFGVVNGFTIDASTASIENCSAVTNHVAIFALNKGKCVISDDRGGPFAARVAREKRIALRASARNHSTATSHKAPAGCTGGRVEQGNVPSNSVSSPVRAPHATGTHTSNDDQVGSRGDCSPDLTDLDDDDNDMNNPDAGHARRGFSGGLFIIEVRDASVKATGISMWHAQDTSLYVYDHGIVELTDVTIRGQCSWQGLQCAVKIVQATARIQSCFVIDYAFSFASIEHADVVLQDCVALRGTNGFTMDNSTASLKNCAAFTSHVGVFCLNGSHVEIDNTHAADLSENSADSPDKQRKLVGHGDMSGYSSEAVAVVASCGWVPNAGSPCLFHGRVYGVESRASHVRCIGVTVLHSNDSGFNCYNGGTLTLERCVVNMSVSHLPEESLDITTLRRSADGGARKAGAQVSQSLTARNGENALSKKGKKQKQQPLQHENDTRGSGSSNSNMARQGSTLPETPQKNSGVKVWAGSTCTMSDCEVSHAAFGYAVIGGETVLGAQRCVARHIVNGFTVDAGRATLTRCETTSEHVGVFVLNRGMCVLKRGVYSARMYGIESRASVVHVHGHVKVVGFSRVGCYLYDGARFEADFDDSFLDVRVHSDAFRRVQNHSRLTASILDYDIPTASPTERTVKSFATSMDYNMNLMSGNGSSDALHMSHQQRTMQVNTSASDPFTVSANDADSDRSLVYGTAYLGGSGKQSSHRRTAHAAAKVVPHTHCLPACITVREATASFRNAKLGGGVLCGLNCETDAVVTLKNCLVAQCVHAFVVHSGSQLTLVGCVAERVVENALIVQKNATCRVSGSNTLKTSVADATAAAFENAAAAERKNSRNSGHGDTAGSNGTEMDAVDADRGTDDCGRSVSAQSTPANGADASEENFMHALTTDCSNSVQVVGANRDHSILHGSWLIEGAVNAQNVIIRDADEVSVEKWSKQGATSRATMADVERSDSTAWMEAYPWANKRTFLIRLTSLGALTMNLCFIDAPQVALQATRSALINVTGRCPSVNYTSLDETASLVANYANNNDAAMDVFQQPQQKPQQQPNTLNASLDRVSKPPLTSYVEPARMPPTPSLGAADIALQSLTSAMRDPLDCGHSSDNSVGNCSFNTTATPRPQLCTTFAAPPPIPNSTILSDGAHTSVILNSVFLFSQAILASLVSQLNREKEMNLRPESRADRSDRMMARSSTDDDFDVSGSDVLVRMYAHSGLTATERWLLREWQTWSIQQNENLPLGSHDDFAGMGTENPLRSAKWYGEDEEESYASPTTLHESAMANELRLRRDSSWQHNDKQSSVNAAARSGTKDGAGLRASQRRSPSPGNESSFHLAATRSSSSSSESSIASSGKMMDALSLHSQTIPSHPSCQLDDIEVIEYVEGDMSNDDNDVNDGERSELTETSHGMRTTDSEATTAVVAPPALDVLSLNCEPQHLRSNTLLPSLAESFGTTTQRSPSAWKSQTHTSTTTKTTAAVSEAKDTAATKVATTTTTTTSKQQEPQGNASNAQQQPAKVGLLRRMFQKTEKTRMFVKSLRKPSASGKPKAEEAVHIVQRGGGVNNVNDYEPHPQQSSFPPIGPEVTPVLFSIALVNGAKGWIRDINEEAFADFLRTLSGNGSSTTTTTSTAPSTESKKAREEEEGAERLTFSSLINRAEKPGGSVPMRSTSSIANTAAFSAAFVPVSIFCSRRARLETVQLQLSTVFMSSGSRATATRCVFTGPSCINIRRKSKLNLNNCTIITTRLDSPSIWCCDLSHISCFATFMCHPSAFHPNNLHPSITALLHNTSSMYPSSYSTPSMCIVCNVKSSVKFEQSRVGVGSIGNAHSSSCRQQSSSETHPSDKCNHTTTAAISTSTSTSSMTRSYAAALLGKRNQPSEEKKKSTTQCPASEGMDAVCAVFLGGTSTLSYCKQSEVQFEVNKGATDTVVEVRGAAISLWGLPLSSLSWSSMAPSTAHPAVPSTLSTTTTAVAVAVTLSITTIAGALTLRTR